MFYRFLAEARARLPRLDVVIVAGNHDSAARLGAADPVTLPLPLPGPVREAIAWLAPPEGEAPVAGTPEGRSRGGRSGGVA